MPDRRHADTCSHQVLELGFCPVTSGGIGNMTIQHGIGLRRVQTFAETTAMSVQPESKPPGSRQFREVVRHLERVGDLPAEIIDQHGQRRIRDGFMKHLRCPKGRASIAYQRMRHGAGTTLLAEEMGRRVGG